MEPAFDLETRPLCRALIASAVRSAGPGADPGTAGAPRTHIEWLQAGAVETALDITGRALLILGRGGIPSTGAIPEDAPVVVGFSLLIMLGITQAVAREGVALDSNALTEALIARHLAPRSAAATDGEAARQEMLELSRTATQIPGQIVATAAGEVEGLFRTCYSVLPAYIQGTDETRDQLMSIFGTALFVLLQARVRTDD